MKSCFILNDTRPEKHHGCEIVMRHLLRGLNEHNIKILGILPIGQKINEANSIAFTTADFVIINGEGTIHHDASYAQYLLECGINAKKNGQKVFLINSTWQDNSENMLLQLAQFDGVWLRDSKSLKEVITLVPHALYAPDLTFAYPYNNIDDEYEKNIIITDSVFSEISNQSADFAKNKKIKYAPIIMPIPITPNSLGYDQKKLRKLKLYNFLSLITFNLYKPRRYYQDLQLAQPTPEKYWSIIKNTNSLIAGRYHALCFGIQLNTPLLALNSNTNKVENLLLDIGLDPKKRIISLEILSNLTIEEIIKLSQWTDDEIKKINFFKLKSVEHIQKMFKVISDS